MDTDSFIIEVIGEKFDDILLENKEIPGKIKDEYGGTSILEFQAPKPESYTITDEKNHEKKCS